MAARLWCGGLVGIDGFRVDLEVDFTRQGLPSFAMVGLAEGAVREARERVMAALRACGFKLPPARITVNLAPADRRKEGSAYDLPLAVGLLAAAGVIPQECADGWFMAGELSLSGELRPVPGILPLAALARSGGAKGMIVPADNASEAAVVEGLPVYGMSGLNETVSFLTGASSAMPEPFLPPDLNRSGEAGDFADVKGQEQAKRAITIAAAGGHNLLFIGPPGSGKSMLARRIPGVLPPLTFDEALEVSRIHSVAGRLGKGLICVRPFLEQHPSASEVSLVGGGSIPRPGAVSLAHRGVLFLDELPEYPRGVLENLRQPLENGEITVSRAAQSVTFPADCMLVAAMNPCPCGFLGDAGHTCTCTPAQIQRYRARLSGPLLDRIDLHVQVPAVPYADLAASRPGTGTAAMRARVVAARAVQTERYRHIPGCRCNADLSGQALERWCSPDAEGRAFLRKAVENLALSARAYTRILRISRTIADLEGAERVALPHIAEAVACRTLDRTSL